MPSYVAFSNFDSACLVGAAAKAQIDLNPPNTVFDSKRLVGNRFSDPSVQNDLINWPFKVVGDREDRPIYQLRQGQ